VKRNTLPFDLQWITENGCAITILFVLIGFGLKVLSPAYTLSVTSHINPVFPVLRDRLIYFHALHGIWPKEMEQVSGFPEIGMPSGQTGRYIQEATIADGAVTFKFGEALPGKTLTLRPAVPRENPLGPVTWVCGDKKMPSQWVVFGTDRTNIVPSSIHKIWRH